MPNCNDERNTYPVQESGQTEATVQKTVCGLNALLENEVQTHRRVGHKNSVSRFHMLTMSKCLKLSNQLMTGAYHPEKGEPHEVFEPKHRVTIASKYPDRVPQSSYVTNYYYKEVIPHLSEANCACMKGRGTDYARKRLKDILREAEPGDWCVKADMTGYFASIVHDFLVQELSQFITDSWALYFFKLIVENTRNPVGLDLGSEVYQLSATSYMNHLDHKLSDLGGYVRYQDDLLFVGSKERCLEALGLIRTEADRLGLTVSEKKTYLQPIRRPVRFLGYSFLRHETGRVTLKRLPEKVRRERRKLKRMKEKEVPIERIDAHYQSVRASMKKGSRSDLMKLDRYYKSLFGGSNDDKNQKGKCG